MSPLKRLTPRGTVVELGLVRVEKVLEGPPKLQADPRDVMEHIPQFQLEILRHHGRPPSSPTRTLHPFPPIGQSRCRGDPPPASWHVMRQRLQTRLWSFSSSPVPSACTRSSSVGTT